MDYIKKLDFPLRNLGKPKNFIDPGKPGTIFRRLKSWKTQLYINMTSQYQKGHQVQMVQSAVPDYWSDL